MQGLAGLAGTAIVVILGAVWLYRRRREVDEYFEREETEPPISDVTSWLGGYRGF